MHAAECRWYSCSSPSRFTLICDARISSWRHIEHIQIYEETYEEEKKPLRFCSFSNSGKLKISSTLCASVLERSWSIFPELFKSVIRHRPSRVRFELAYDSHQNKAEHQKQCIAFLNWHTRTASTPALATPPPPHTRKHTHGSIRAQSGICLLCMLTPIRRLPIRLYYAQARSARQWKRERDRNEFDSSRRPHKFSVYLRWYSLPVHLAYALTPQCIVFHIECSRARIRAQTKGWTVEIWRCAANASAIFSLMFAISTELNSNRWSIVRISAAVIECQK